MGSLGQRGSKGKIELRWYQGSFYRSRYKLILMDVRFESKSVIRQETLPVELMNFTMKETNYRRLCSTKTVSSVNDNFPGPTIPVHKWDTVFLNIHDRGKYGITIHWHGIRQPRNPWSDGLKNIMMCPIPLNTSFTQEIIFFIEGTLWWHAHSDWSRATIHGAIIILPTLGTTYVFPKPYAEEAIVPAKCYKGDVMTIIDEALTTGGDPKISDAITINGQPENLYECSNIWYMEDQIRTTYRLPVNYGRPIFYTINSIMNVEQCFGIAKHYLIVVGTDGAYIKPIKTNYIMITPGQTMEVFVTANQSPSQYYIAPTLQQFSNIKAIILPHHLFPS